MENFKIIGISTETSNQNNQAAADLGKLWERFFAEEIASKIPNKENEDIYAIYTDYESDYTGRYTTIIGQRVSTLDHIPDGFVGREIKNERLIKYKAKGEMPRAVVLRGKKYGQTTLLYIELTMPTLRFTEQNLSRDQIRK